VPNRKKFRYKKLASFEIFFVDISFTLRIAMQETIATTLVQTLRRGNSNSEGE